MRESNVQVPRREAGSTLIIAITVLIMLTMLGLITLQTVAVDVETAGAERASDAALYIAEAGIQWGIQHISLNYVTDPSNPDFSDLTTLPTVTAADPWGPGQLVGWHELHASQESIPYGTGAFRVVVETAPDPDTKSLLLRSLGISGGGARRLLEVAILLE